MTAVADATPLIAFARVDRLGLFRALVGTVLVPPAVYDEVVFPGRPRSGSEAIGRADWIHRTPLGTAPTEAFPAGLGAGEREAIVLAKERSLPLVTDDLAAYRCAVALGITVTRTLSLLVAAEERDLTPDAAAIADEMIASGLRVHDRVRSDFDRLVAASRSRRGPGS